MKTLDQTRQLMILVPYLQARPDGVSVDELAQLLGISRAQVFDVLHIILFTGLRGGLTDDLIDVDLDEAEASGMVFLRDAEFLRRPLNLTDIEAVSLLSGLQLLRDTGDDATRQVAERVITKLTAIRPVEANRVSISVADAPEPVRAVIDDAIRGGHRLKLDYRGPNKASQPVVDPVRRFTRQGVVYLQAYKLPGDDGEGWRTYRLERIAAAESLAQPATDHGSVPEILPGWTEPGAREVILSVPAEFAWVAESYPNLGVTHNTDTTLSIRMAVFDEDWFSRLLLRLGSAVLKLDPSQAGDGAKAAARAALQQYEVLFA
jgi:proteasome accessory factor C